MAEVKYTCTCGLTATDEVPRSAADHCPACRTRPSPDLGVTVGTIVQTPMGPQTWTDTGHRYYGGEELRCFDCDGRPHSHRRYPGDPDYEAVAGRRALWQPA